MNLDTVYFAVLDGNAKLAAAETTAALAAGVAAADILHEACIPAMDEVGCQFEAGDKFVPEMLLSARAMQGVVQILRPYLMDEQASPIGVVLLGTVAGDMHDIGKNLVGMMMEGAGFRVVDIGVDAAPQRFVDAIRQHKPDIVGLSALLTTTMPMAGVTISAIEQAGLRNQVKIMVGGAPTTQEFADAVGADGYAADCGAAPRVAKALLGV